MSAPEDAPDTCSCHDAPAAPPPGYTDHRDDVQRRLRRIEGQVRGLQRMVDADRYCIDVITQITAVQSGLRSVALQLLDEHLAHCVVAAARAGGDEQRVKLEEVSQTVARLVRP